MATDPRTGGNRGPDPRVPSSRGDAGAVALSSKPSCGEVLAVINCYVDCECDATTMLVDRRPSRRVLRLLRRALAAALVEVGCPALRRRARITFVALISYPHRLADHAAADPDHPALTDERRRARVTRAELESLANRTARALAAKGVGQDDLVTIALPNSASRSSRRRSRAGSSARSRNPCRARLPKRELDAIIELAAAAGRRRRAARRRRLRRRPVARRGVESVQGDDVGWLDRPPEADPREPGEPDRSRRRAAARHDSSTARTLMPGPLYHNGPFIWTMTALLAGNHVVLGGQVRRASARSQLIDRYHPDSMYLVPTMMARISKLPPDVRDRYDVSSLKVVWHLPRRARRG